MNRLGPQPHPGVLSISPYVPGNSNLDPDRLVRFLGSNENRLGCSEMAQHAFRQESTSLHRYPDGSASQLRRALARQYGLDFNRIVCGNGSDDILTMLARAYLSPGDEAICSQYGFLEYPIVTLAQGAIVRTAPGTGLNVDPETILSCVSDRTRVVFLANPNNPTGTCFYRAQMDALLQQLPEQVLLVIDAAYAEFVQHPDYDAGVRWVERYPNVVMTRTFSKIHGLASLRIGWAYAPQAIADAMNRIRGPFVVSGPALAAATASLRDHAFFERSLKANDQGRKLLATRLSAIGLTTHIGEGNFLLIDFSTPEAAAMADHQLRSDGIILRQMAGYSLPHMLRATIGTEEDINALSQSLATMSDNRGLS